MIILTDIHGNFDTMIALLDTIPQEEKDKGIIICGDLVDRGPKSLYEMYVKEISDDKESTTIDIAANS